MIGTRILRRLAPAAAAATLTLTLPLAALAAPTWSPIRHVADGGRPAAGASIATTRSVDHRFVHATWRRGAGIVEFARSADGGASWSTPVVLNASAEISGGPRIAADGHDVWVAFAKHFEDPDTGTPGRAIIVRHNGRNGASGAWDKAIRLTARSGDVRSPVIAVTGSSIYIAFSDLREDSTRVIYSHDGGHIWTKTTVGLGFEEDFEGVPTTLPAIAAAGDNVLVAWLAVGNIATARVSTDGADHWSDPVELGEGLASAAARGGRMAILGASYGDQWLRIWHAGSWGPSRDVPEISLGFEVAAAVAGDVVLRPDHRVGVVYSAQVEVDEETADTWEEITWVASPDDGVTWNPSVRVSRAGGPTEAFVATNPTAVWLGSGRLWIGWEQEKAADPGHRFFALRQRS